MVINTKVLKKAFTEVGKIVCKDTTRPAALAGVLVEVLKHDTLRLVATDGRRMYMWQYGPGVVTEPAQVSAVVLPKVAVAAAALGRDDVIWVDISDDALLLGTAQVPLHVDAADYPPYRKVIKLKTKATAEIGVDAKFLAEGAKFVQSVVPKTERGNHSARMSLQGDLGPIHVRGECDGITALAVIMPMRM